MDPIEHQQPGGEGYDACNIDGVNDTVCSGGGHSGGGIFISARDQARFGLVFKKGKWKTNNYYLKMGE
jgi:hypothetical protein